MIAGRIVGQAVEERHAVRGGDTVRAVDHQFQQSESFYLELMCLICFNSSKLPGLQPKVFCASQRVQNDSAFIWILRIKEALERVIPVRFGSVLNSSAQNDALLVA